MMVGVGSWEFIQIFGNAYTHTHTRAHTHMTHMKHRCLYSHCGTKSEHVCAAQKQPCSLGTQMRDSAPIMGFPVVCVCVSKREIEI